MTELPHFPPVSLLRFQVDQRIAEDGRICEVKPLADRDPYDDWSIAFATAAEAAEDIEWADSGVACCAPNEVERVKDRLREIASNTNDRVMALLAIAEQQADRAEIKQLQELLDAENDAANSADGQDHPVP
jgi:hypothetical protein